MQAVFPSNITMSPIVWLLWYVLYLWDLPLPNFNEKPTRGSRTDIFIFYLCVKSISMATFIVKMCADMIPLCCINIMRCSLRPLVEIDRSALATPLPHNILNFARYRVLLEDDQSMAKQKPCNIYHLNLCYICMYWIVICVCCK